MGSPEVAAMAPYGVLIVGCGKIAGGFDESRAAGEPPFTHAGAFRQHPGFRLSACVEPDPLRRREFMQRWSIPAGFSTIAELQAAGLRPAVVSICSPTDSHAADLEAAVALRPSLIFCEKPVTPSLAATHKLVGTCEQAGIHLAVNYTRRWAPDVIRLKTELEGGHWGAVRGFAGLYNKGVLNNGGHMVDLVRYLAGPLDVIGATDAVHDFFAHDPTATALLRSREGVPVSLTGGHAADYSVFELQVIAENGLLVMENGGMNWRLRKPTDSPHFTGYRSLGRATEVEGLYGRAMAAAVENLHAALTTGAPLLSTGRTAIETQAVCERILHLAAAPRGDA